MSAFVDTLRRGLDVEELVEVAQALIRCQSVNPPGNEQAAARCVEGYLSALGVHELELVTAAPGRVSVLARWGTPGGRALIWNGHLDVVPAGEAREWKHPPFSGIVSDGRLWGRGSVDMKGSVACVIHALAILERAGVRPGGEVVLQIVGDEETGGAHGSGYLAERGLLGQADAAICGEPTGLDVLVAARGRLWLEVTTFGVSAHAAQSELGRNALTAMGRVLDALGRVELPEHTHPLVGRATLTPTTIAGGTAPNTVPDRCTLAIDRRFLPSEDADAARGQIEEVLACLESEHGVESRLVEHARFEASEIDPETEIVRVATAAAEAVTGRTPAIGGMPGSTDARFLVHAGIPTVIFGPGELGQAHTTDESISLDELAQCALCYAAIISRFLGVE